MSSNEAKGDKIVFRKSFEYALMRRIHATRVRAVGRQIRVWPLHLLAWGLAIGVPMAALAQFGTPYPNFRHPRYRYPQYSYPRYKYPRYPATAGRQNAFLSAVNSGNVGEVAAMLGQGANVNVTGSGGITALMIAAERNNGPMGTVRMSPPWMNTAILPSTWLPTTARRR